MTDTENVSELLEQDHRAIDEGFAAFVETSRSGRVQAALVRPVVCGLRLHIYLEEEFLFQPLRDAGLIPPILVMLREHGEIWHLLDELDEALATETPEPERLLEICNRLEQMLAQHNLKEERILYPAADQIVTEEVVDRIRTGLAGNLPKGWVSEQARRETPDRDLDRAR